MSSKLILTYINNKDKYSDGEDENKLLEIFNGDNVQQVIKDILENDPSWPMRYHLSPVRENLLNWYDFDSNKTILEIGAGCGAVTGTLCNKLKKVTAIELTEMRSKIIAARHKDKKNLTVIAGNLNDIVLKEKFDYVSLIGVLEYAGKYTQTQSPFIDFLSKAKTHLKKNGTLIIAIENKFGLKYWAGCKEDHTGKFFDSIENYPTDLGVKTFSKNELEEMVKSVGLDKVNFYYPLPDYKLPTEIFSDKYLPTLRHNIKSNIFPFEDYSQDRMNLFNEKLVMDNIIANNKFDFFANSFLIFAKQ